MVSVPIPSSDSGSRFELSGRLDGWLIGDLEMRGFIITDDAHVATSASLRSRRRAPAKVQYVPISRSFVSFAILSAYHNKMDP